MPDLNAELTAIAGEAHVFADQDVVAGYATDWTRRYKGSARGSAARWRLRDRRGRARHHH